MTYRTPNIAPVDPASIGGNERRWPDLFAHIIDDPTFDRSRIEIRMRGEQIEGLIETITHEIHHDLLDHLIGRDASYDFDNIAGNGAYLINGDVDFD